MQENNPGGKSGGAGMMRLLNDIFKNLFIIWHTQNLCELLDQQTQSVGGGVS